MKKMKLIDMFKKQKKPKTKVRTPWAKSPFPARRAIGKSHKCLLYREK